MKHHVLHAVKIRAISLEEEALLGATCCHEAFLLGALQHIDDSVEQVGLPLARVEALRKHAGICALLGILLLSPEALTSELGDA